MTPEVKRTSLSPARPVFPFVVCLRLGPHIRLLSCLLPRPYLVQWLPCPGNVGPREHRHALNLPSFSSANFFFNLSFYSASTIHVKDAVAYWHYD